MQTLSIALILVLSCQLLHYSSQFTCASLIYCSGDLLDTVQRAELFEDSKTFVDMMQIHSSKETLKNFKKLKNKTKNKPTNEDIRTFVKDNFATVGDLQPWTSPDFNSNPKFLKEITNETENCYRDLKSGAESGWDSSSRWLFNSTGGTDGNLSEIQTRRVVPVDLNAILCRSFTDLASFYLKVGHASKVVYWKKKAEEWIDAIVVVLYDMDDGIWYDYDIVLSQRRKGFYTSNFAPLWTKSYHSYNDMEFGKRAADYFKARRLDAYLGGVPASLNETGEQWDFPSVWPPLQEIIILGLSESEDSEAMRLGKEFAVRWISANILGYKETGKIFEKYDAVTTGFYGGGGKYSVQDGFGWTNGVALSLINKYYGHAANSRRVKGK